MARHRKEVVPTMKCLHCRQGLEDKNFYKSNGNIYSGINNYIPVCKDCIKILYEQYRIKYINQFSVLGAESEKNAIKKLAIRRLCMTFDIYYNDRLFDASLKQIEKFPTLDMVSAYMKIANLKQSRNKTYDDTILEENLSQELLKSAIADKVRKKFNDCGLYQDIYDLCLKLMQSLKENCNVDVENDDYSINDLN